ncbi:MAG TPA: hypothetical protein VLM79_04120 [Kofleriaceae bacterium]|nr:hypothetical protein [Kofleriaceae bacterium]
MGLLLGSRGNTAAAAACPIVADPDAAAAQPGDTNACGEPRPSPAPTGMTLDDGNWYVPVTGTVPQNQSEMDNNTDTNCEGDYCYSGLDIDPDASALQERTEPDASQSTAGPGATVTPDAGAPANQPIHKTFHKDEGFGNSNFGASYAIDAALDAIPATASVPAKLDASGQFSVSGRAFGSGGELVRALLTLHSDQYATVNSKLSVFLAGFQVWSKDLLPATIDESPLFDRALWSDGTSFPAFGYYIDVDGTIQGTAGTRLQGALSVAGPRLILTPSAELHVTASVSIGFIFNLVRIGIEGTVTLIKLSAPIRYTLAATDCSHIDFGVDGNLVLNTLSGKLKLFVKIKLFFISKKKSITITSWNGTTRNSNVWNVSGSEPFNFICTPEFLTAIPPPPPPPPPPPRPRPPRDPCPTC